MSRAYYSNTIADFLSDKDSSILGELTRYHQFDLEDRQKNAWIAQIKILKVNLSRIADGHIFFEYTIPRMGKRIDTVIIRNGVIYAIEFKVGEGSYTTSASEQVLDYALDLKIFHQESHVAPIIPIVVATEAPSIINEYYAYEDKVYTPIKANRSNLGKVILDAGESISGEQVDPGIWKDSLYKPTPTIIEAAQALYRNHDVQEISRSDSGAINLTRTTKSILDIIEHAKCTNEKAICFVTGVPGADKHQDWAVIVCLIGGDKRSTLEKPAYLNGLPH